MVTKYSLESRRRKMVTIEMVRFLQYEVLCVRERKWETERERERETERGREGAMEKRCSEGARKGARKGEMEE